MSIASRSTQFTNLEFSSKPFVQSESTFGIRNFGKREASFFTIQLPTITIYKREATNISIFLIISWVSDFRLWKAFQSAPRRWPHLAIDYRQICHNFPFPIQFWFRISCFQFDNIFSSKYLLFYYNYLLSCKNWVFYNSWMCYLKIAYVCML